MILQKKHRERKERDKKGWENLPPPMEPVEAGLGEVIMPPAPAPVPVNPELVMVATLEPVEDPVMDPVAEAVMAFEPPLLVVVAATNIVSLFN